MKTETRLYDDGTEPDVITRWCCDGRCNQGRDCPGQAPAPAEACTDVGMEEVDGTQALGTALILGALVVAIIGTLAFFRQVVGWHDWIKLYEAVKRVMLMMEVKND